MYYKLLRKLSSVRHSPKETQKRPSKLRVASWRVAGCRVPFLAFWDLPLAMTRPNPVRRLNVLLLCLDKLLDGTHTMRILSASLQARKRRDSIIDNDTNLLRLRSVIAREKLEVHVCRERGQLGHPERSVLWNMIRWQRSGLGKVAQVKRGDDVQNDNLVRRIYVDASAEGECLIIIIQCAIR